MPGKGLADLTIRDVVVTALLAIVVASALRLFVIGAYVIPSHSMENTLLDGDYVVVSKLSFLFQDVTYGDVVVFSLPDSLNAGNADALYVKRVIGLPGDTVTLTSEAVFVNGNHFPTPSTARPPYHPLLGIGAKPVSIAVKPNACFVLGDNRSNSFDSRYWGCLPLDRIQGSPLFIYWSYGTDESTLTPYIRWDRTGTRVR